MKAKTLFGLVIVLSICGSAFAGVPSANGLASTDWHPRGTEVRHVSAPQAPGIGTGLAARRAEIWKRLRGLHTLEDAQPMGCNFQCTNYCSSIFADCVGSQTQEYCESQYWICMCEHMCCTNGCD